MSYQIRRVVRTGLHIAIAMETSACLPPPGVACGDGWCSDRELCASLTTGTGMQQLLCVSQTVDKTCVVDTDCPPANICDTSLCRVPRSCDEILRHMPGSKDGMYSIAPDTAAPFKAVCDMTRDGGGWTLLLKATGDAPLGYSASAWTDANLLNASDLTTEPGNAKYQSFLALPVTTLRGELDGFRYTQDFASMTAQQIFAGPAAVVHDFPTFNTGAPNWSAQPSCHTFGVNTPYNYARARFGWSANEQADCDSNDTALGLGLMDNDTDLRGAGYECYHDLCTPVLIDTGGNGLLWAK